MFKIFRSTFLPFLVVMMLVAGGACYQTISIVPFWQKDISMFRNYGHWGIDYFPILSPLMTALWLVLVVTGFKVQIPSRKLLYTAHILFLALMVSTFTYFAPFLLTNMGHPEKNISVTDLTEQLNTWALWDMIRQVIGVITLGIFLYIYGKSAQIDTKKKIVSKAKVAVPEESY